MASFKFPLAAVLRLREHMKNQKQWELRALYDTRQQLLVEIDDLEKQLLGSSAMIGERQIFTAHELKLLAEHDLSLAKRIKAKRAAVARFDETIAEKRAQLVEAMRAIKSLEQLRQRHEERYWRAQNGAEQRFNDEIAQRKYVQPEQRKKIPG